MKDSLGFFEEEKRGRRNGLISRGEHISRVTTSRAVKNCTLLVFSLVGKKCEDENKEASRERTRTLERTLSFASGYSTFAVEGNS